MNKSGRAATDPPAAGDSPGTATNHHSLLFTGHMIDAPGRKEARFPPQKEAAVKEAIAQKVAAIMLDHRGRTFTGIAGGACGGDILFHEVCAEAGIPTVLYLALPKDAFLAKSVSFANSNWTARFEALYEKLPRHILAEAKELSGRQEKEQGFSIWEQANILMLQDALENGGANITLIALWDGKSGDGPGGTKHMVSEARGHGGRVEIIDIAAIRQPL